MKLSWKLCVNTLLAIALTYFLWAQGDWRFLELDFPDHFWLTYIAIAILSLLNWNLEALKWKYIIADLSPISRSKALAESLQAHAWGIVSPLKIGEYPARLQHYDHKHRKALAHRIFFNNAMQLLTTLIFGLPACYILLKNNPELSPVDPLWILILSVCIAGIYYKTIGFPKNWILSLSLSIARYIVFSSCLVLILKTLHPALGVFEAFLGIGTSYAILTLIPLFSILDWVAKTAVFVWVFQLLGLPKETVAAAVSIMWLTNWGFPALSGYWYHLKLQWK